MGHFLRGREFNRNFPFSAFKQISMNFKGDWLSQKFQPDFFVAFVEYEELRLLPVLYGVQWHQNANAFLNKAKSALQEFRMVLKPRFPHRWIHRVGNCPNKRLLLTRPLQRYVHPQATVRLVTHRLSHREFSRGYFALDDLH